MHVAEMAQQTDDSHSAQAVGNTFISNYYPTLHKSPDSVHKFYTDSSVLSRPNADGVMTSVTTVQVGVVRCSICNFEII